MIENEITETSTRQIAQSWINAFDESLLAHDYGRAAILFAAGGYWRDILSFTWKIATFKGPKDIEVAMRDSHGSCLARNFRLEIQEPARGQLGPFRTIDTFFVFETELANGRGFLRLTERPDVPGEWKALNFLTTINELKDFPEHRFARRRRESSVSRGLENWLDQRIKTAKFADEDPDVLIVGAGQAGLALGARLTQLDVSTLIVDRMERVGDNWRKRYHSLTLHNEICTNHLPYLPFPDTWPVYIPKDMLADFMEFYAKSMELNIWTGTSFIGGEYDAGEERWIVRVQRADGEVRTMRPRQVVMAVGVSGIPNVPSLPGMDRFNGRVVHSSGTTDDLDVTGKSVLVVGAGTSAHDIAQDLHLRGGNVTMLQRSSTTVVSLEPGSVQAYSLYRQNEGVRPTEETDLMSAAVPFDLVRQLHGPLSRRIAEGDKELLDKLQGVGFLLDNGEDDTGFFMKLLRYLGGYYVNVGASDLIIDGKIKLKSGVAITRVDEDTAYFSDGASMAVDVMVMATGYKPLQEAVRSLFGSEVADLVGPIWGLGEDGELRNMWTRTKQDGFFVAGGTLTMCRFYSHVTALLIRATLSGLIPKSIPITTCEES